MHSNLVRFDTDKRTFGALLIVSAIASDNTIPEMFARVKRTILLWWIVNYSLV